jgi:hypothetical protein
MKPQLAFLIVLIFASFMVFTSCGNPRTSTSEKDVPDSALTDSIPASGENEYQQDLEPEGRTEQLDSARDTVGRKPN